MSPLIDEHVRAVGEEVRELARLHGELARTELREGSSRFVRGIFLFSFGILTGALVLVAAGVGLFFVLDGTLSHAGAAAAVAGIYLGVSGLAMWLGWRWIGGVTSVMLPRTRAMLWELLTWREDKPTDS